MVVNLPKEKSEDSHLLKVGKNGGNQYLLK